MYRDHAAMPYDGKITVLYNGVESTWLVELDDDEVPTPEFTLVRPEALSEGDAFEKHHTANNQQFGAELVPNASDHSTSTVSAIARPGMRRPIADMRIAVSAAPTSEQ